MSCLEPNMILPRRPLYDELKKSMCPSITLALKTLTEEEFALIEVYVCVNLNILSRLKHLFHWQFHTRVTCATKKLLLDTVLLLMGVFFNFARLK